MLTLAEIHEKKGRPFNELYEQVTKNILAHTQMGSGMPTHEEYPVVQFWVDSFILRYNNWVTDQPVYLDWLYNEPVSLYRGYRKLEPVFVLCALAFLHIANDLPISIAESLEDNRYNHYTDNVCELNKLKGIFNELEKPITGATSSQWRKPWLVSIMLFPPLELQAIFTLWIINLRMKAWDNAMNLYCNPGFGQGKDPKKLLQEKVLETMKAAKLKSRWMFYKRIVALTVSATIGLGITFQSYTYFGSLIPGIVTAVLGIFLLLYLNEFMMRNFYKSVLRNFEITLDTNSETRGEFTETRQ